MPNNDEGIPVYLVAEPEVVSLFRTMMLYIKATVLSVVGVSFFFFIVLLCR